MIARTVRIIAGEFKGLRLKGPGSKNTFTRPMLDRVRESLFSILSTRVKGNQVLDLCSGTGSIGLEALSRGAAHCVFVEQSSINIKTIRYNIEHLGVDDRTRIVRGTLPAALRQINFKADLVLFDPPFALDLAERTIPVVLNKKLLNKGATVVIERSKLTEDLAFVGLRLESKRIIGDSVLWIFIYE